MDFHAVFETLKDGRWFVHDLHLTRPKAVLGAYRQTPAYVSDAAFAAVTSGIADLQTVHVTAVADPFLLHSTIASWFSSPESVA